MKHFDIEEVKIEVKVNPCSKCGSDNILLSDNNYSSFNCGGGRCRECKNVATSMVGTFPKNQELAEIWNRANPIPPTKEEKISSIRKEIQRLQEELEKELK